MNAISRRQFLRASASAVAGASAALAFPSAFAQSAGERPSRAEGVTVLNPRGRVPVGLIIDDSTCLVNLNRFAMPQFDAAFVGANKTYDRNWREWPVEIPDAFVRKFGEWCAEQGVKGKYSIVPYPACVGRLDRGLPGWTQKELADSIELVRTLMLPNWDIHPEMVTHTRVIDTKTGHPHSELSLKFMENWEWTTGRSADEIADYMAYALRILKNIGLPCEGITTPGGFGNKALPQLAQATLHAVRDVFGAEIPHYFRHLYDKGDESVKPRVEYASGLDGADPRCVVSIIGCTGDWTGGWDNTPPGGADKFITEDLQRGRMVEIIQRGEPALMLAHWTGIHWNGQELGFKVFQEVVRRLHARFDNLIWMKLSEVARYWAARELTRIERSGNAVTFHAPFASPDFTVRFDTTVTGAPRLRVGQDPLPLKEVTDALKLTSGTWRRDGRSLIACFALPKGKSQLELAG
ncbi:MAG TPA: twin-arginine translocation signal domain-containing protein [Verrucomicrobiae bacterium]|nr:twin-arginine translocation signal domain-containing protein [Verrucomicrobiae bacterium]